MAVKKFGSGKNQPTLAEYSRSLAEAVAALPPAVVVSGSNEYLRAEAVSRLKGAWLQAYPGGDTVILRGAGEAKQAGLDDIVRELSGSSLFAREKLVLVRQAERLLFPQGSRDAEDGGTEGGGSKGGRADKEKSFLAILSEPPNKIWLVLETAQLPRNRALGKKLAELAAVIPCPDAAARDLPAWLSGKAEEAGKRLDPEASDLLIRAHGADFGILAAEIEKLTIFAGDAPRIDAAMAGEFMTGAVEFDIFSLTNAVEERNARRAMYFARKIAVQGTRDQRGKKEDGERSAHRALSMLAGTLQGLLKARIALAERRDAASFAAAESLNPWRAGKLLDAAGRFDLRELRALLRYAADQIRRSHDTGGDPVLSLELIVARLAM